WLPPGGIIYMKADIVGSSSGSLEATGHRKRVISLENDFYTGINDQCFTVTYTDVIKNQVRRPAERPVAGYVGSGNTCACFYNRCRKAEKKTERKDRFIHR